MAKKSRNPKNVPGPLLFCYSLTLRTQFNNPYVGAAARIIFETKSRLEAIGFQPEWNVQPFRRPSVPAADVEV